LRFGDRAETRIVRRSAEHIRGQTRIRPPVRNFTAHFRSDLLLYVLLCDEAIKIVDMLVELLDYARIK
jgi:hypothetical protein